MKKWLGIDEIESYVENRKRVHGLDLDYMVEQMQINGKELRQKDLDIFAEKLAQKYNRGMIKSLVIKVLKENPSLLTNTK